MHLYSLTELTGRKSNDLRTVSLFTIDWRPRVLAIVGVSSPVALIVGAVCWTFMGSYAVLVSMAVVAVALWLFATRTADSRDIYRWEASSDSARSRKRVGKFHFDGHIISPHHNEVIVVKHNTIPFDQLDKF